MPLSWNEIRQNAIRFARDWAGAKREHAEKQTFWNEFFGVFGISRRAVASFEKPVRNSRGEPRLYRPVLPRHDAGGA